MSRHLINGDSPDHHVVVGYDRPQDHFYAQITDKKTGESVIPEFKEFGRVSDLQDFIVDFAHIPNTVAEELAREWNGEAPTNRLVDHRKDPTVERRLPDVFAPVQRVEVAEAVQMTQEMER